MPDLDVVGWIVVGLIAGAISGALVGGRTARGCLPNIVIGIIGGVVGGWLAQTARASARRDGLDRCDRRRNAIAIDRSCACIARTSAVDRTAAVTRLTRRPTAPTEPIARPQADRPYSPGLEGVIAGETSLSYVDGANGRLLYRGYRIGDLVEHGTYPAVANLLWTGDWDPAHRLPTAAVPAAVDDRPSGAPGDCQADGRAADRRLGLGRDPGPALATDRRAGARADRVLAVRACRVRAAPRPGKEPIDPDPSLDLVDGIPVPAHRASARTPATARALDAYFIVGAEHGFNASTFTARVITSTRSDIASAVAGAIGTMKGPLHGGAPSEVVDQLRRSAPSNTPRSGCATRSPGRTADGVRPPRVPRLRPAGGRAAQGRRGDGAQARLAPARDRGRGRRAARPGREAPGAPLKTNVEYYAAPVLMGVGLAPDLFPATFSLARHAGWTAHALEQAANNRLIRPDVNYVGPEERDLPG